MDIRTRDCVEYEISQNASLAHKVEDYAHVAPRVVRRDVATLGGIMMDRMIWDETT
jgi:hypothetical protein